MCREFVTVALCAPERAPYLSFTCGRLHLVAESREVCKDAKGDCICFFGGCGTLEKITSTTSIDFSDLRKARCAECTKSEDNVGDRQSGQQLVESPLLVRKPVTSPTDMEEFKDALKTLWKGEKACPFHAAVEDDKDACPAQGETSPEAEAAEPSMEKTFKEKNTTRTSGDSFQYTPVPSPANSVRASSISPRRESTKNHPQDAPSALQRLDKRPDSPPHGLKLGVGLSTSRWANAEPIKTSPTPARKYNGNASHREGTRAAVKMAQMKSAKEFLSGGN